MANVNLKQLTPIRTLPETQQQDEADSSPSTPGLASNVSSIPSSAFSTASRQPSWGFDEDGSIDVPRSMKILRHRQSTNDLDIDNLLEQLQVSELPARQSHKQDAQVLERIGQGTHSNVFRGTLRGTTVAVKVANAKSSEPFIKRELAMLNHICSATNDLEHIVEHFYSDQVNGKAALYMELGECNLLESLKAKTVQHKDRAGPIAGITEWQSTARILASAVHALHAIGVVHGDIKPQNFVLCSGSPKLIDFEAAFTPTGPLPAQKGSGHDIMGSNVYSAPELLRMTSTGANFTTDIYALGVTLLVLATGVEPYQHARNGIELIIQCQSGDPIRFSANKQRVTPEIEKIVRACCAKAADDRWTIQQLREALDTMV